MKKLISYITVFALATVMAGCDKNTGVDGVGEGEGRLIFDLKFNGKVPTRAEAPADVVVRIANSAGVLYKYEALADVPAQLWLVAGSYTVSVEGGTKTAYGWDTPYYRGSEIFTIQGGESTSVTVDCLIQNTLFTVGFDKTTVTDALTGYSVTLFPISGDNSKKLVFDGSNPGAVAYVMLDKNQTTMDWTFAATHPVDGPVTKSGTLTGLEMRKKYELSVRYTSTRSGDPVPDHTAGGIEIVCNPI